MKISVNIEIEMSEKETEMYIKEDNNMYNMHNIKQMVRDQIRNEVNRQARYNAKRNNK